jgi:3-carboxy-cis,cis-muconate cycloisomerase
MGLYSHLFGDAEVDALLSEEVWLQTLLDVEVAIAEAAAEVGLVPVSSVPVVRTAAVAGRYDRDALAREAAEAGNLAIPLVRHFRREVAALDPSAAAAVHVGATSQDVLDTALVLQLRAVMPIVLARAAQAAAAAARLARTHRDTPMAGRTWLQQASPITFGLKAAGWLDAIGRARLALDADARGACVLQFGGASGTLASLGGAAEGMARKLAARLDLSRPELPWHTARDRLVRLACGLGILVGTFGKIGRDLALLAQTEVGEAFEAPRPGRGGSSTMPHKRNPVSSAVAVAAAVRAPGLVASMLAGMPQEHERALGGWQAEWEVLPDLVRLAAGSARAIGEALDCLSVDADRMRANLGAEGGLALSEAVVAELAPRLGRLEAQALVERACGRARAEGRSLADVLSAEPALARVLAPDALARCFEPGRYLGQSRALVDRALAAWTFDGGSDA